MSSEAWVGIAAIVVTLMGTIGTTIYCFGRMTSSWDSFRQSFDEWKRGVDVDRAELFHDRNEHEKRLTTIEVKCGAIHGAHGE